MRRMLLAVLTAAALPTAALPADASKVRAAYEQLCTGDAPGSLATCAALRAEMEKAGVPGTKGWMGALLGAPDDGTKAVRVYAVDPGGPAATAGLRTGDLVVALDGQPYSDAGAFLTRAGALLASQQVSIRVVRGEQILDLPVTLAEQPKPAPKLNSQRTDRGPSSMLKVLNGLSGAALTVDKIRVGEQFYGILEDSDAQSDWGKREDCLEIADVGGARNLAAFVTPNGAPMRVYVLPGRCDFGVIGTMVSSADSGKPFGINFATQAGSKTYLMVSGAASAKPYEVIIRDQTPKETIAWRQTVERQRIADQQRREAEERAAADRRDMFGAAVQGLILGFSGAELPAMREDGSRPNMLETLNAANAALERQNAESAARLNATIARAQAQEYEQRRAQPAQAQAKAEAERQQQAQRAAQDRQAATIAFGNARAGIEQRLREAAVNGDRAQLAHWQEELKKNDALAGQYGVTAEVRQYAQNNVSAPGSQGSARTTGQGQLGQTPLGGFPAPIVAPKGGQPPSTPVAQPQAERATICYQGQVLGAWNPPCDPKQKTPQVATGPGANDGSRPGQPGGGGSGGGGTAPPGGGTRPPGNQPPGQSPIGGGGLEYENRPEGVTLCQLTGYQAQFKNYTCTGPLQMNYVNFEKPNWAAQLLLTCGGKGPARDLGVVSGYRAFGCGHAIDPAFHVDVPRKFGVSYVPGRITYRCRKDRTACVQG